MFTVHMSTVRLLKIVLNYSITSNGLTEKKEYLLLLVLHMTEDSNPY